jgi:predicted dithiol-disulfide oxidoreductase (DUF899 family)
MSTTEGNRFPIPAVVSQDEWRVALQSITAKEKEITRLLDAAAAARRRLPMVKIEKNYRFQSDRGEIGLVDLFEGRKQLILYHFMFAPDVGGWPHAGCVGCSMFVDQISELAHLHARDVSICLVSVAPLEIIEPYKKRMGWNIPWYSSAGSEFNVDFGVTTEKGETHGLSVFLRDGNDVYRTYFTTERGVEILGSVWTFLDLTPYGRQEQGEDSPPGWPQTPPFAWWRRHDEYEHSK